MAQIQLFGLKLRLEQAAGRKEGKHGLSRGEALIWGTRGIVIARHFRLSAKITLQIANLFLERRGLFPFFRALNMETSRAAKTVQSSSSETQWA